MEYCSSFFQHISYLRCCQLPNCTLFTCAGMSLFTLHGPTYVSMVYHLRCSFCTLLCRKLNKTRLNINKMFTLMYFSHHSYLGISNASVIQELLLKVTSPDRKKGCHCQPSVRISEQLQHLIGCSHCSGRQFVIWLFWLFSQGEFQTYPCCIIYPKYSADYVFF